MADISKIQIESGIYDIKDQGARDLIANIGNEEIILVGDSYLEGVGTTNPATDNFGYLLMQKLGMDGTNFHRWAEGGSSFTNPGSQGHNWLQLVESRKNEVTRANITKIIFAGGYNDVNANSQSDIEIAMNNTITAMKSNFVNAKVYVCLIGNNGAKTSAGATNRNKLKGSIYRAYCNAPKYGGIFMDKGQLPLQDYRLYESSENKVHPNGDGNLEIANYLYQALMYETADFIKETSAYNFSAISGFTGNIIAIERLNNRNVELSLYCSDLIGSINQGEVTLDLGEQDLKFLRYTSVATGNASSMALIRIGNNTTNVYHRVPAIVYLDSSSHLKMQFENNFAGETINKVIINWVTFILEANRN